MGDFDLFTNEHVRNYFELKRSGQYEKALEKLQIACDQGDGQAFYIMGTIDQNKDDVYYKLSALAKCPWGMIRYAFRAPRDFSLNIQKAFDTEDNFARGMCLFYGYGDIERDVPRAIQYMREACKQNNPFAIEDFLDMRDHFEYSEYWHWVKRGAELGSPKCQYKMGELSSNYFKESVEWHLKAYSQKYKPSTRVLAGFYWYGNLFCKQDKPKGIKLAIEGERDIGLIQLWLEEGETDHLQILFVFGQELSKNEEVRIALDRRKYNITVNPIRIYRESIDKTQKAVVCFLLSTKHILVKDIRQLIGKIIWAFRKDPEIWEIKK